MRNIIGFLLIICLFSIYYAFAGDVQSVSVKEQVIVNAKWGNKSGEIGNVLISAENQTAGESINPIALDKEGNIYIGDSVNSKIKKFNDRGGTFLNLSLLKNFI